MHKLILTIGQQKKELILVLIEKKILYHQDHQ